MSGDRAQVRGGQDAQSIARVRARAMKDGKAVVVPPSNPLAQLIEKPNPILSRAMLLHAVVVWLVERGECFVVKVAASGAPCVEGETPAELWPQDPTGWKMLREDGSEGVNPRTQLPDLWACNEKRFRPESIIHFRMFSPANPYRGLSPLTPSADAIASDKVAARFNIEFFRKGANPGGIFSTERNLSQQQRDEFKRWVTEQVSGIENAQQDMLLEKGTTFSWNPRTQKDAQFLEMRDKSRDEVLATIGTAKGILSITDALNYATFIGQKRAFWETTVIPWLLDIEDTLWSGMFAEIDGGKFYPEFDLSGIAAIRDDLEQTFAVAQEAFALGYSRDEINERFALGFDPNPATDTRGGDASARASNAVPALMDLVRGVADGSIPPESATAIIAVSFPHITDPSAIIGPIRVSETASGNPSAEAAIDTTGPDGSIQHDFEATMAWADEFLDREAPRMDARDIASEWQRVKQASVSEIRRVVSRYLSSLTVAQRAKFDQMIAQMGASGLTPIAIEKALFTQRIWDAKLGKAMSAPMRRIVLIELARAAVELGVKKINLIDPEVTKIHRAKVASLVQVNKTTRTKLRRVLHDAMARGLNQAQTAKLVEDALGKVGTPARARTIAWTETAIMQDATRYEFFRRNADLIRVRKWVHDHPKEPRDSHVAEARGRGVPVGERYPVTGLLYPHEMGAAAEEVINCRCHEIAVLRNAK